MHVSGSLNPADIATRANSKPGDVMQHSPWQRGPDFLYLPRTDWPMSREFLNYIPEQELRNSRAVFNAVSVDGCDGVLEPKLMLIITQVMDRSNCLEKVINVTARLLKCLFS